MNFRPGGAISSLANVSFPWTRNCTLLCLPSLKAGHLQELSQKGSLRKEVRTDPCFGFTASDFMIVTYTLYVGLILSLVEILFSLVSGYGKVL